MSTSPPSLFSCLRTLFPLVSRRKKWHFLFLIVLSFVMAASEFFLAGLVGLLAAVFGSPETVQNTNPVLWLQENLGFSFGEDSRYLALTVLFGLVLAVVLKNALSVIQQWYSIAFSESMTLSVRTYIFRFYQRAPYLWISHTGVADLNFGFDSALYVGTSLNVLFQFFTHLLVLLVLLAGLLSFSLLPSLLFILVLGLGGPMTMKFFRSRQDKTSSALYQADYQTRKITHLALHGLREVRLYARENPLFSALLVQGGKVVNSKKRQGVLFRLPGATLEILGFSVLLLTLFYLIVAQNAGMARISGIMGLMAAIAWRGLPAGIRLMDALTELRNSLPYLRKIAELFTLEQSMAYSLLPLPEKLPAPLHFQQGIRLEKVSFRYPGSTMPALEGVSLEIRKGSMLGLVGLSGAGKSTLVNLVTGLLLPDSGRILADETVLDKDNARAWIRNIGYVAQAPYILDATLAENVALSHWGEAIDRERVQHCCRMAALDFLDDLEQGIDTLLGERGTRLSGGQAQRVAIARALYSEPDVIIFDEATSSLDIKNEKAIHDTILSLRKQATLVIIAHRLSTVEGCDEIVWLDKGKVYRAGRAKDVLPEYEAALRNEKTEGQKKLTVSP